MQNILLLIVFLEGFASVSLEVLYIRHLITFVGSNVLITSWIIGVFLFALSLGYYYGGKIKNQFMEKLSINLLISGVWIGMFSSNFVTSLFFFYEAPLEFKLLVYLCVSLIYPTYLMGQTVPIITNMIKAESVGEISGKTLFYSTLGSVLSSLTIPWIFMQYFGVQKTMVFLVSLLLILSLFSLILLSKKNNTFLKLNFNLKTNLLIAGFTFSIMTNILMSNSYLEDNAYSSYRIAQKDNIQYLVINEQAASGITQDGKGLEYLEYIKKIIKDIQINQKDILVLGSGGFTLSHNIKDNNNYTYIDIDPAIKKIAEEHFLKTKINGIFIPDDARNYLIVQKKKYDIIVVDVYSNHQSIPSHLLTQNFWKLTQEDIKQNGHIIINLILSSSLRDAFSQNILNTIESVYGQCTVEVLNKKEPRANVIVTCENHDKHSSIYNDDLLNHQKDYLNSKITN